MEKSIALSDFIKVIEDKSDKMKVFIDSTSNVERFLNYKGQLVELNKFSIKAMLPNGMPDIDNKLRVALIKGLRDGQTIGLLADTNWQFDVIKYLSQFKWFDQETFFNPENHKNRDYLRKMGILTDAEDEDVHGNKGNWDCNEKSKIILVYESSEEHLKDIKSLCPEKYFEYYHVK